MLRWLRKKEMLHCTYPVLNLNSSTEVVMTGIANILTVSLVNNQVMMLD